MESGSLTVRAGRTRFFRMIQALEASPAVSYILDARHRFIYCNPAWDRFAKANGAPQIVGEVVIGADLFNAVPEVLKPAYSKAFDEVSEGGGIWEKPYECSSPELFRKYRMRIHFLKSHAWFLITNPLVVEQPHVKVSSPAPNRYFDKHGLVMMCIHCRCSRRVDNPDQWDFVPEYLKITEKDSLSVSHGFCPLCEVHFYPDLTR